MKNKTKRLIVFLFCMLILTIFSIWSITYACFVPTNALFRVLSIVDSVITTIMWLIIFGILLVIYLAEDEKDE